MLCKLLINHVSFGKRMETGDILTLRCSCGYEFSQYALPSVKYLEVRDYLSMLNILHMFVEYDVIENNQYILIKNGFIKCIKCKKTLNKIKLL